MRDPPREEMEREIRLYRFSNQIMVASNPRKKIRKGGKGLSLSMNWEEGGPLVSKHEHPDEQTITEMMVVMRPLLDPESDIHYAKIVEEIKSVAPNERLDELLKSFQGVVARICSGGVKVPIQGEQADAEGIYLFILKSVLETDDTKAMQVEREMARDPVVKDLMWFSSRSYCTGMFDAIRHLDMILKREKLYPPEPPRDEKCIYCTSDDRPFTTREHTLPESLGNATSVLPRGWVCDECQGAFSKVEGDVLNMLPFSWTRIMAAGFTKGGKFPSARFAKAHIRKTRPNRLEWKPQAGPKSDIRAGEEVGDYIRLHVPTMKSEFDHIKVARMLIKGALGAIAWEKGREAALDSKYDSAREFARTGAPFEGRLAVVKRAGAIIRQMQMKWFDNWPGAMFDIHGVKMAVSLMPHDRPELPPAFAEVGMVFELDVPFKRSR